MVSSVLSFKALASILSVASLANAHMIMKTPIPYGRGSINNSPLAADGSDFPCKKITNLVSPNDINYLVPGVPNILSFTGSAVHGGGSCQVSLTTDLIPTKDSKWSVIKSIEGGCPANVDGNLPENANGNGAAQFQYTVPVGFAEGEYTIAWTWFNRIGNREMYMNCGRAKIANSKKRYAPAEPKVEQRAVSYPNMFTANLGIFGCNVAEGTAVEFPNPGADVQRTGKLAPPTGSCPAGSNSNAGSAGNGGAPSAVASSAVTSAAATTGRPTTPTTTVKGPAGSGFASGGSGKTTAGASASTTGRPGIFVSASASASQPTIPTQTTQAPVATVVPIAPTQSAGSNGTGSGPSVGSNVQGSVCSQEGAWACAADGKSFQRCASGIWSASMQVAAGTTCSPGVSMDLSMRVVSRSNAGKRDFKVHEHRSPHRRSLHLLS